MSRSRRSSLRLSAEKQAKLDQLLSEQGFSPAPAERIVRRPHSDHAPLSFAQQRLWFLDQWSPGTPTYNMAGLLRLEGPLNLVALAQSINAIVSRHEVLRTRFDFVDGHPMQVISGTLNIPLPLVDLTGLPLPTRALQSQRLSAAEARKPFDLSQLPLLRVRLLRLHSEEHLCVLVVHHIVSDLWSMSVLMQELTALYAAFSDGRRSPLNELPIEYADFSIWQKERIAGAVLKRLTDYWKSQLADAVPVLNLPSSRPRPASPSYSGARCDFRLDREVTDNLKSLSRTENVTLFMTLSAAFLILLYRYTGQSEICVGSPVAGRFQLETEALIGCFVNPLVMRGKLNDQMSCKELLDQVRKTWLEAEAHAEMPYERLVEELQPQRDLSRNPLFQVMLVMHNTPTPEFKLARLKVRPEVLETETSRLDLTIFFSETKEGLKGSIEYSNELFDEAWMERLSEQMQRVLGSLAEYVERRVSEVPVLSQQEREYLLRACRGRESESGRTLLECFAEQVRERGEAIAVADAAGEQVTYEWLEEQGNKLSVYLRRRGLGAEARVGVLLGRSVWLVTALLGVAKAGAAYVALEPTLPPRRLEWQLSHGDVGLLVTERRWMELVAGLSVPVVTIAEACEESNGGVSEAATCEWSERLAYLMYTSGTTGEPKGVGVSWGALDNFLASMAQAPGLSSGDVLLAVTTVSFDIAGLELWLPLRAGGRLELASAAEVVDGQALRERMRRSGVTVMQGTPALWRLLLLSGWEGESGLRLLCGGERWSGELAGALGERSEQAWNMYGPTETTIWSAARQVGKQEERVAVGGAIANTELYVLDAGLELSGLGVWGEVWIGGAGLARGYEKRAELTAERYRPDGYSGRRGGRLYGTGDVGRVGEQGLLELSGRKDEQVKVRGHRVELGEVESELRRVEGVREAVVVAQEEASGEQRLIGYVVPESAGAAVEWRVALRERLPEYMIPSLVLELDQLPLTANGKIDRRALPTPDKMTSGREAGYVPLVTDLEQSIAEIWKEVLQLPRIGARDNFFDLGGHSLRAAEVRNKLSRLLHREIPMVDLFKYPTVRSLAQYLGQLTNSEPTAKPTSRRTQAGEGATNTSIAVIGMGLRFPGARTVAEYWANLRGGVESVSELSAEELARAGVTAAEQADPQYVKVVPEKLFEMESFDAGFFGFSPREALLTDPQQRVLLETAWEALETAGYDVERYAGAIGVWAGAGVNRYLLENLLPEREWLAEEVGGLQVWLGNEKDFLSTRVSYKLNLHGPSMSVSTACSTSLVAVHLACQSLLSGECEMALAGGVSLRVPERSGYRYQPGGVYSPDGHCRPFDERAGGTMFGSGAGLVVLKRVADAVRDGDTIWAVLRGTAINNDGGRKVGYTAPSVQGQAAVIAEALALAQVEAETIGYVEAHGTGTELGDPIELAALSEVFGPAGEAERRCALGSVKANFGHLDTAAGVAGLLKVVLALKHGEKPPQVNYERANGGLDLGRGGFYVNVELERWESEVRRAGVSSFGIGGTNAHVVVESWGRAATEEAKEREWQLLLLSGRSEAVLERQSEQLASYLGGAERASLADVAYTLAVGRKRFSERRYVVCRNYEEALAGLAGESVTAAPGPASTDDPSLVFMFPGQGTQRVNMGRELYESEPVFRHWIDLCSELLQSEMDVDLRSILYPKEEQETASERLKQTLMAQPALFVTDYALAKLWMSWGLNPSAMIGHSLGEYVAACLAGVISLEDALGVVAFRARLMQSMPEGAMMSLNLSEHDARSLIGDSLSLACVNGPSSCVVSGPRRVIQALETKLTEAGVGHHGLNVSHAFHSALMDSAVDAFAARMKKVSLSPPRIPFISNTTGTWIGDSEAIDPNYWALHMRRTVRFSDGLQTLQAKGKHLLLEVGFGQTLGKLANSVLADGNAVFSSFESQTGEQPLEFQLLTTLGKLWQAGLQPDWSRFYGPTRRRVPLPTYPFERQQYWVEGGRRSDSKPSFTKKTSDWFSTPVWKQSVSPHLLSRAYTLTKKFSWLIFQDDAGLGACLVDRLRLEGQKATAVVPGKGFRRLVDGLYEVAPDQPEDYQALLREIGDELPQCIVNLWGVTRQDESSNSSSTAGQTTLHSLVFLAQAIGSHSSARQTENSPVRIAVVTNNMQQVSGTEKIAPEKALVLGPCKVIPQEYEGVVCRSIDVALDRERPEQLVEQLIIELGDERPEPVIAYRGPQRWVQAFDRISLEERTPDYRQRGVYLIVGGLGGVGLALANDLALSASARLILVGRSTFPDPAQWQEWLDTHLADDEVSGKIRKLQVMEEAGAEVLVLSADVTDAVAMRDVITRGIERFGPINGAIQAAGVAPQGLIQRKTADDLSAMLAPKVLGTEIFLSVLKDMNLDFVVLCSSIRSLVGGPGAVDYCAANAFLDATAQAARPDAGRVISINWDGWKNTGMAAHSPLAHFLADDEGGLSTVEGVEAFRHVLASNLRQVVVSTVDLDSVMERAKNFNLARTAAKTVQTQPLKLSHPRTVLSTSYVGPRNETERTIANIWQKSLGIELVGMLDNFFELGGDSTISIQIMAEAYKSGLRLSPNQIFQYPTIAELASVAAATGQAPETKETTPGEGAAFGWEQDQLDEILESIGQSIGQANGQER